MVSNQIVTRSLSRTAGLAAGLALLFAAGCQTLEEPEAPTEAPAAPVRTTVPVQQEENAVEAALARGEATDATPAPAPAPAPVTGPVLNPNAPSSYVVKRGDTLWDISSMFLRDPWLWPEIWHVNPAVANPHLIYPGDTLVLVYGTGGAAAGTPGIQLIPGNAIRVSPLVRSSSLDGAIATIPYAAIASFLGKPGLLSKEDVARAPKVAAVHDDHLMGSLGHAVYVKGMKSYSPGRYSIVRVGDELKDPETGRVLGYMASYAAAASVDSTSGQLSKALLVESVREAVEGDVLFSSEVQVPGSDIIPHAAPAKLAGQIMAVVDGLTQIGQFKVVAINRGSRHGAEVGHVLAIDQKGAVVPDGSCKTYDKPTCRGGTVRLPDVRAGTLLVFKTYEQMSYGLVMETLVPLRVADMVRTP
jgi:hypothetical protein